MSKKRHRLKPEQIIAKLRDADVMLNSGEDLSVVLQSLERGFCQLSCFGSLN